MAITVYTEQQLYDAALGYFRLSFPTQDLSDRGMFGLLARAFARFFSLAQQEILQVNYDAIPAYQQDADGNVRSRTSSSALDEWAFVFGLPSGVAGIWGRRGATISTGGSGTPTGVAATLIPSGSTLADPTGQIFVETTAAVTLNGPPNTNTVPLVSTATGVAANLPAGTVLTWQPSIANIDPTMTLTDALVGAEDIESDVDLLARILRRIQLPPRGGTANDYRNWTEEATNLTTGASLGIERGYVYPLRSGLGTVDVVPLQNGSGSGRIPGGATLVLLLAYLNSKRPVTATVNVVAALAVALRLRVRVRPSPAKGGTYLYDWNDAGLATAITNPNSTNKTIECAAPAALKAAVDAGQQPRIQIINSFSGAGPLPFQARVVSYVAGAPDVLTLDSFPAVGPVGGTDYFWAGGGVVDLVASRLLTYVDSVGPSRQSGYADTLDAWEADITLARVADVVMETKDSDGTRMILDIPRLSTNGITIAVGSGAFAPNSYTPRDVGSGIELATLRSGGGLEIVQAT